VTTFSQRILGSPDIYQADRRSPLASVNFITAHDGFTLADLTSYEQKHNEANGEDNNDGESDNKSFNGGVEGPTDEPAVQAYRDRQRRNLLATVLLSAGVPMLLGGDEIGRTQGGNNNAYCQDNEISWFDWAGVDTDLLAFTTDLIQLRREHRALRPSSFRQAPTEDVPESVEAVGAGGDEIEDEDWTDPHTRAATFVLEHEESSAAFALLLNSASNEVEFVVPSAPHGPWELASSSDPEQHVGADITELLVRDASFTLLVSRRAD
jgi:isoamylase